MKAHDYARLIGPEGSQVEIHVNDRSRVVFWSSDWRGNLAQAVHLFNGLNISNGYKKRLVSWSFNRPVLARQFSR